MKKLLNCLLASPFLFSICLQGCSKDDSNNAGNITLYNQSVPVIQSYLNGRWKVDYTKGGLAYYVDTLQNAFMDFKFGSMDSLYYTHNGSLIVNSPVIWDTVPYIGTHPAVILRLPNGGFDVIPLQIHNDTLILEDPNPDSCSYWLSRVK